MSFSLLVSFLCIFSCSTCRLRDLQYNEDKIFSQNGEDGILLALLDIIGIQSSDPFYVEFGVGDGSECNTRILREMLGFRGLSMDSGYESESINLRKEFVTEHNILDLFRKYEVPPVFEVLSVDVDMFDWWVLLRILVADYKPRIIIVETNPTLCVEQRGVQSFIKDYSEKNMEPLVIVHPNMTNQESWDGSRWAGANPAAFRVLAEKFGYEMVYAERCGVNAFLVQISELPQDCVCRDSVGCSAFFTPYPCFATSATQGAYPGHIVDAAGREVVRVSDVLLEKVTSATNPYSLSDITSNFYSCSSRGNGWGKNWCSYLYPFPSHLAGGKSPNCINSSQCGVLNDIESFFNSGRLAFDNGGFDESIRLFGNVLTSPRFPSCRTHHKSELACVLSSAVHYNLGLSYLRGRLWFEALREFQKAQDSEPSVERVSSVAWTMRSLSPPNADGYSTSLHRFKSKSEEGQDDNEFTISLSTNVCDDVDTHVNNLVSTYNIDISDADAPSIYLMQIIRCCFR